MDSFWSSTLSSVTAAAIGWVFSALIGILTRKSRWRHAEKGKHTAEKVYAQNRDGNQVVVAGDGFDGNVQIVDGRTIVHQNMSISSPQAKSDGDHQAEMVAVLVGGLVASALFLTLRVPLMWFTAGMACGLLVTLFIAVRRTSAFGLWGWQAVGTIVEVVIAVAAAIYSWIGVSTQSWHGNSIESIAQKVQSASAAHPAPPGILRELLELIGRAIELFKVDPPYSFAVVLVLLGAVVMSGALLIRSWSSLFDWCAYVGFIHGPASQRLERRAKRFESRGLKDLVGSLLAVVITAAFASGVFFLLIDAASRNT